MTRRKKMSVFMVCSVATRCFQYLAPLTRMHAIMEARRLVPADFALHADP